MKIAAAMITGISACLIGCGQREPEPHALNFYIVHEHLENGTYIDTDDFPKLGYVAKTPDLTITRLANVETVRLKPQPTHRTRYHDSAILLTAPETEAGHLKALSAACIDKQLLIMLGLTPLAAPVVQAQFGTEMQIIMNKSMNTTAIVAELQQLSK